MKGAIDYAKDLLFPYQRAILEDDSRFIVVEKSRRIGGTFIFALKAIIESLHHNWNAWFSSSDEKNGKEWIIYVKQWCNILNTILGTDFFDLSNATTECVFMPNGCRLTAVSSNPTQMRGKDGIVILDEVAFRDDQEALFTAAHGSVMQKGKMYVLSTHNGPATRFYHTSQEAPANGYSKHKITLQNALEQGYAVRFAKHLHHLLPDMQKLNEAFIQEVKRTCPSPDSFAQEFECEPLSLQALISEKDYDALAVWDVDDSLDFNREYRALNIGIDVGRSVDSTVIWVIEQFTNANAIGSFDQYDYKTVCVKRLSNMALDAQVQIMANIVSHPSVSRVLVDQGTVGRYIADTLSDRFSTVEPFAFTAQRKAILAERVAGYVKMQRVSFPKVDKNKPETEICKEDVLCVQRMVGDTGLIKYDGNSKYGHGDALWALALALQAAEEWALNGAEVLLPA